VVNYPGYVVPLFQRGLIAPVIDTVMDLGWISTRPPPPTNAMLVRCVVDRAATAGATATALIPDRVARPRSTHPA
jgi:hypothetical protein